MSIYIKKKKKRKKNNKLPMASSIYGPAHAMLTYLHLGNIVKLSAGSI